MEDGVYQGIAAPGLFQFFLVIRPWVVDDCRLTLVGVLYGLGHAAYGDAVSGFAGVKDHGLVEGYDIGSVGVLLFQPVFDVRVGIVGLEYFDNHSPAVQLADDVAVVFLLEFMPTGLTPLFFPLLDIDGGPGMADVCDCSNPRLAARHET